MILTRLIPTIVITLLLSASTGFCNSDKFGLANEMYSKNNYSEAIKLYEEVVAEKGHSASLYFNIGNSYAQLGQNGKAISNYEKALRLEPHNADIIKNLSYFKKEAGLFLDEQPTLDKLLNMMTTDWWAILSLVFLLTSTLTVIFWKKISSGSLARGVASLTVFLTLTAGCGLAAAKTYMAIPAYVVIKDSKLKVSPFEGSESKGLVKDGRTVRTGKTYKEFVHIEDEAGQQGWVETKNLEQIVAPSS